MPVLNARNVGSDKTGSFLDVILTQVLCFADVAEPLADEHGRQSTSCFLEARLFVWMDALSRDFDFGDPAEGEQQLYEILGWLFGRLLHDVADSVGDCGLEHHTLRLQASKVHTHKLPRLQHHPSAKM